MKFIITEKQYKKLINESLIPINKEEQILATLGFLYKNGSSLQNNLPSGYDPLQFMGYKKELYKHLQMIKDGGTPSPLSSRAQALYNTVNELMKYVLSDHDKMKEYIELGKTMRMNEFTA